MKIQYVIIKVDDQDKALEFYTSILGFKKKVDLKSDSFRWLTVSSPEGAEGAEIVLEPNFPPSDKTQKHYLTLVFLLPYSARMIFKGNIKDS